MMATPVTPPGRQLVPPVRSINPDITSSSSEMSFNATNKHSGFSPKADSNDGKDLYQCKTATLADFLQPLQVTPTPQIVSMNCSISIDGLE